MNRRANQDDERIPALEEVGLTPESCDVFEDDPHEWLEGPEDYALYLDEALATGDPKVVVHCLQDIALVMGITPPDDMLAGIGSFLNMLRGMNVQLHASERREAVEAA